MSTTPRIAPRILERDEYRCVYCGRGYMEGALLSVDHVTPVSWYYRGTAAGDPDVAENLVCACNICNSMKRDMNLKLYAAYLREGHGLSAAAAREMVRRVRNALRRKLPE